MKGNGTEAKFENGSEQWLVDPGYLLYTGNEM